MKVKCIENDFYEDSIILNKIYDVKNQTDKYFCIVNEHGNEGVWHKNRFQIVNDSKKIELSLSEDEADTLCAIMNRIAGDPVNSPRKFANSILYQLRGHSLSFKYGSMVEPLSKIAFLNFPKTAKEIEIETLQKTIADAKKRLNELLP